MSNTASTQRLSVLWFIAATAVLWLIMSTSSNRASRYFTVYLESDLSYFENSWLLDSAVTCRIQVEAEGLQSLFLQRFREREVPFDARQWMQFDQRGAYLSHESVERILQEHHGSQYQFSITGRDTVRFQTIPFDTLVVPVRLQTQGIALPSDYRWITAPYATTDSLWLIGPTNELELLTALTLEVPSKLWVGKESRQVDIPKLGEHVQSLSRSVVVVGESAQWIDLTIERNAPPSGQPITVWLSGPRIWLNEPELLDKYLHLRWNETLLGIHYWAESELPQIQVLTCTPQLVAPTNNPDET